MLWDQRVVGSNPISPTINPIVSDTSAECDAEQTRNERKSSDGIGNNSSGIVPEVFPPPDRHGGLKITDVIRAMDEWGFESLRRYEKNSVHAKFTYFARCTKTGKIKIGRSAYLEARMRQLSRQAKAPVELLASIRGGDNETMYLWWFSEHRLEGEWFNPAPEILAEIDRINSESAA